MGAEASTGAAPGADKRSSSGGKREKEGRSSEKHSEGTRRGKAKSTKGQKAAEVVADSSAAAVSNPRVGQSAAQAGVAAVSSRGGQPQGIFQVPGSRGVPPSRPGWQAPGQGSFQIDPPEFSNGTGTYQEPADGYGGSANPVNIPGYHDPPSDSLGQTVGGIFTGFNRMSGALSSLHGSVKETAGLGLPTEAAREATDQEHRAPYEATDAPAPSAPTKGYLRVRILAGYGLVNRDTGLHGDVSDPYVVAKVGTVTHRTPCIDNTLDPVWEHDNDFSFPVGHGAGALELQVMNANLLVDTSLGSTSVPLWKLSLDQWHRHRDRLEGVASGELSYEVRFSTQLEGGSPTSGVQREPELEYPFGPPLRQPRGCALPFDGVRVLEVTRRTWTAALCGRMLAACGADVVRVAFGEEALRVRKKGRRAEAAALAGPRAREVVERARSSAVPPKLHSGKRLAPHNLDDEHERSLLHTELLPGCDVLLTDLPMDELDSLQLGYHQVHTKFPGLVYVHASSIGTLADLSQKGVEDAGAFYCLTGFAEQLGHYLGPTGFAAATAASALFGITCLAVMRRRCGAPGDRVELSVFRSGRWCTAVGALTKWARPPRPDLRFGQGSTTPTRVPAFPFEVEGVARLPPRAAARTAATLEPLHLRWKQTVPAVRMPALQPQSAIASELPLARVTVIELSDEYHVSAAAVGSMLADLGAQVTKVERPQRPDPWKKTCKQLYDDLNGKKLIQVLNYTGAGGVASNGECQQGQAAMYRTLADTTMLLTNLPLQALDAWGFGIERLRAMFPHLVIVVVSTWGCDLEARCLEAEGIRKGGQEVHSFWEASGLSSECFANLAMPPGLSELAMAHHVLGGIGLALLRQQRSGGGQLVHVSRHGAGLFSRLLSAEAPRMPLASPLLPVKNGRFMRLLGRGHRPHDAWVLLQGLGLRPSLWEKCGGSSEKVQKHLESSSPEDLRAQREELVAKARQLTFEELAKKFLDKNIDWFVEEVRPVDAEALHKQRAEQVEELRQAHQDAVEKALQHANESVANQRAALAARAEQERYLHHHWEQEQSELELMQELQRQHTAGIPPDVFVTLEGAEGLVSAIKGQVPDTYCVVQILQKQDSRITTSTVQGTSNPEWDHPENVVQDYELGDTLVFAVFSKDHADDAEIPVEDKIETGELFVTVHAAHNLKNLDTGVMGDVSDPYVVVRVGTKEFKTKTINDNLNPEWTDDNQFTFALSMDDTKLHFNVMNSNYIKDDSLGEYALDIRTVAPNVRQELTVPLANGDGAQLKIDVFVKPPHPCQPHNKLDQLIGRADLETNVFYPKGYSGVLNLFMNGRNTNAILRVNIVVRPRDLQNNPMPVGRPLMQGDDGLMVHSGGPGMDSGGYLPGGGSPGPGMDGGGYPGGGNPGPGGSPMATFGCPPGSYVTASSMRGVMPVPSGPGTSGPPMGGNITAATMQGTMPIPTGPSSSGFPVGSSSMASIMRGTMPVPVGPSDAGPMTGGMLLAGLGGVFASAFMGGASPGGNMSTNMRGVLPIPMEPNVPGSTTGGNMATRMQGVLPVPMDPNAPTTTTGLSSLAGLGGIFGFGGSPGSQPVASSFPAGGGAPGPMSGGFSPGGLGPGGSYGPAGPYGPGAPGGTGFAPAGSYGAAPDNQMAQGMDARSPSFHDKPPPDFEVPVSVLHVRVNGALKLRNKDTGLFGDVSDPYVAVRLGQVEYKTPHINNNLNPIWENNNYFKFEVGLEDTTLMLEVLNKNTFKDDSLGTAELDLRALQRDEWCQIKERLTNGEGAELELDIFFKPTDYHRLRLDFTGMVYLRVNGAVNLLNKDTGLFGDLSDPYVKVKVGKTEKRTPIINNNLNPVWEEGNQFTFAVEDEDTQLEVEVMNSNNIKDDTLGSAAIPLHRMLPEEWCSFREKLENGGNGEILIDAYWKPTEFQRNFLQAQHARVQEGDLGKRAAELARQVQEAEYSAQWLEDVDSRTGLPLSVEEKEWENACAGRNLVIPAWIIVKQTQLRRSQQGPHPVALFPGTLETKTITKAKVKIAGAEGLHSAFLGDRPNAYCVCEIPLKPESAIKTPFVPSMANPEWRHSRSLKGYALGDSLVFNVYSLDQDCIDDSGNSQSDRRRRRDELLGTACLAGNLFYPDGFDGLLDLTLAGRGTGATLRVTAFVH